MTLKTKQQLIANSQDLTKCVAQWHGMQWTNTIAIAEQFEKPHNDVLKKIRKTIEEIEKETDKNTTGKNFLVLPYRYIKANYINEQNKEQPYYKLNKELFLLVVMSFTGSKAFTIKNDFIIRFSELEQSEQEKKKVFAGSKGGYKGQFERVKNENEDLKLRVAKLEALGREYQDRAIDSEAKLNIALKGMLKIAEEIEKIQNK